jgi:hypothetical protein
MGKGLVINSNKKPERVKNNNRVLILGVPDMKLTKHHIVPSSRLKEPMYARYIKEAVKDRGLINLCEVPNNLHQDYHRLFANLTPLEIIAVLVEKFWGGQLWWLQKYLENKEHYDNNVSANGFYNKVRDKNSRKVTAGIDISPSIHHIVPRSRQNELEYATYIGKTNKIVVPRNLHDFYHWLFVNFTPPEIISVLVAKFWSHQIFWVEIYLEDPKYFNNDIKLLF